MTDLNLATTPENKVRFCNRARSKMIAQAIQGHVSQTSWNKTMANKKWFAWCESSREIFL